MGFADAIKNEGFPGPPDPAVEKLMKPLAALSPLTAQKSGTWVKSLIDSDPRAQISEYFKPGMYERIGTGRPLARSLHRRRLPRRPIHRDFRPTLLHHHPHPSSLIPHPSSLIPHPSSLALALVPPTGDKRGPCGFLRDNKMKLSSEGEPSQFFSVWRPTSMIALRMMLEGRATGKGLNVKGKSARQGELSGFVPFLQISEEAHKHKVGTSPKEARIRVYYQSSESREAALAIFQPVLDEMDEKGHVAEGAMKSEDMGLVEHSDDERDAILKDTLYLMDDPTIELLDPITCDTYGGR